MLHICLKEQFLANRSCHSLANPMGHACVYACVHMCVCNVGVLWLDA